MADFDPDAFLSGQATPQEAKPEEKKDDGFDPDAFLANQQKTPTMAKGAVDANGPVAPESAASDTMPLPQFSVPGPTGFNPEAVKATLAPFLEIPGKVMSGYKGVSGAGKAIADAIVATHTGGFTPFGGANALKGLREAYLASKESLNTGTKIASQFDVPKSFNTLYDPLKAALTSEHPELLKPVQEAFARSGPQGVKNILTNPEAQKMLTGPATQEAAQAFIGGVPGVGTQIGRAVAPVLRVAGKVLGPAGLAMNAYDAAQYAEAAELGKRLAQGQGGTAQHQFKQMNPGYSQQFNQQITPDQAHLILNSNNERDIAAFGGREALTNVAQTPARQVLAQPPTSQNFMQRMQALGYLYHSATQGK